MAEGPPGPAPAPAAPESRRGLLALIRDEIGRCGPMPFSRYMDLCLYHPEWGYYGTGRAPGRDGADFWTAPEMSPAFGRMVGRQVADMHRRLGTPSPFTVVEYGAGSGSLARALLDAWAAADHPLYRSSAYRIVERSPALVARQRRLLAGHGDVVTWLEPGESGPLPADGVVVMNEVLDALPVDRLAGSEAGPLEIRVGVQDRSLVEVRVPADGTLSARLAAWLPEGVPALPVGHEVELAAGLPDLVAEAAGRIRRGYLLVIDYGFTAVERLRPERRRGTLMAYSGHQALEDPLTAPGAVDLTAHADWDALDRAAAACGFTPLGRTTQMRFLLALGLGELMADLEHADLGEAERTRRRLALTALIKPGGMGEMFKVWMAAREAPGNPSGLTDPFAGMP